MLFEWIGGWVGLSRSDKEGGRGGVGWGGGMDQVWWMGNRWQVKVDRVEWEVWVSGLCACTSNKEKPRPEGKEETSEARVVAVRRAARGERGRPIKLTFTFELA